METYKRYAKDVEEILSHRHDNGGDYWMTPDYKLLKGSPFSTLDCLGYLHELEYPIDSTLYQEIAKIIFAGWKQDGRIKIAPSGGIYPCHTSGALIALCTLGYASDERVQKTFQYFIDTQEEDGGWKCNKYSFGRGSETQYSTPNTTLQVLDAMRYYEGEKEVLCNRAVTFLLMHWEIKKPISPCHYGIGKLFKQIEYPFRGYGLFYYVYILSFYPIAHQDPRFLEAFALLKEKTVEGQIVVERIVPKLAKLSFCKKGEVSEVGTKRFQEILDNFKKESGK